LWWKDSFTKYLNEKNKKIYGGAVNSKAALVVVVVHEVSLTYPRQEKKEKEREEKRKE
jgi:hypothetical protein